MMSDFDRKAFDCYNLPPGYSIRIAKNKDTLDILKYEFFSDKIVLHYLAYTYPISILFMLPAGYTVWEILQKNMAFELGIEPLKNPNFTDWLYIVFEASKFALTIPIVYIVSFLLIYLSLFYIISYKLIQTRKKILKIIG